ncbi:MAG: beta-propeller domain-containing protein [Micropepsaceae bacterium]
MTPSNRPIALFRIALATGLAAALTASAVPIAAASPWPHSSTAKKTLTAFRSDSDLQAFLKRIQKARRTRSGYGGENLPVPSPAPPAPAAGDSAAAAPAAAEPGITNTQEAGVDEGGIVKNHGDMLVILRRGRLFTVSTRNGELKPVDSINAFPPGVNPQNDWYDEMLVAGDRVIVIGYSYGRGGTEVNRFHIDSDGDLSFEDAYHIRSNDYYSSRNYASRLIGNRLIIYSPLYLPYNASDNFDWMPAVRRWNGSTSPAGFRRTATATDIYMPVDADQQTTTVEALHSVTDCDLTAYVLNCSAKAVLGPAGRTFYVSPHAVYVWVNQARWGQQGPQTGPSAFLYRLPLDRSAPSAIGVRGAPTDQFSFREDWNEGMLNVLVRGGGGGDAMWNPEFSQGSVTLLQMPLRAFGDGGNEALPQFYRPLPAPSRETYAFQNRFVGDYVLYGNGAGWGTSPSSSMLVAAGVRNGQVATIPLQHGVDRIEAMGRDAVVIGSDGKDLHFRAIELTDGYTPHIGDRYTMQGAAQGETRSQAFYFKPEVGYDRRDRTTGLLGLPVTRAGRPGYQQLEESSAAVVFIRRAYRQFSPLGELGAKGKSVVDDRCQASCVDWYGNSRPIFMGGRTFALMGYELVEGEVAPNAIHEVRRISFAPGRGW